MTKKLKFPDSNNNHFSGYNDIFNAKEFIRLHKNIILNCEDLGGWFIWNDRIWEKDTSFRIDFLAQQTIDSLVKKLNSARKVANAENDEGVEARKEALRAHVKSSGNQARLKAMAQVAKSMEGITVKADLFDQNQYLINTQSGTYDLKENILQLFNPKNYMTKMCRAYYDESAKCPHWEEFIHTIFQGDKELIDFIQKACGYLLAGDISQDKFFILYGDGFNGKSTFVNTLLYMLGDYAGNIPVDAFVKSKYKSAIDNDIALLKGLRFAFASESDQSVNFDESVIKRLTSIEPMKGRFLYEDPFYFEPTAKVFFATNNKPTIQGTDDGIWRRVCLIPFNHKFDPKGHIKNFSKQFLYPEISGIFLWCLEGWRKLQKENFNEPETVQAITKEYKQKEDSIAAFINEFCIVGENERVTVSDLWHSFTKGFGGRGKRKDFNEYIEKKYDKKDKQRAGDKTGVTVWFGIRLKTALELSNTDEDTKTTTPPKEEPKPQEDIQWEE